MKRMEAMMGLRMPMAMITKAAHFSDRLLIV
jgi:hypothetical protein